MTAKTTARRSVGLVVLPGAHCRRRCLLDAKGAAETRHLTHISLGAKLAGDQPQRAMLTAVCSDGEEVVEFEIRELA